MYCEPHETEAQHSAVVHLAGVLEGLQRRLLAGGVVAEALLHVVARRLRHAHAVLRHVHG